MEYGEIDCQGKFWLERLPTLPSWHESYIGRIVYVEDEGILYFGSGGSNGFGWEWTMITPGGSDLYIKTYEADSHSGTITPSTDAGGGTEINLGASDKRYANIYGVNFQGTTTTATYADLAEKYTTKNTYPTGTIMKVSESHDYELDACDCDNVAVGVISENPGFVLNNDSEGQLVGLAGKLSVRINGEVKKGDIIIPDENGCGKSNGKTPSLYKVCVALETNMDKAEKLVECMK